MRPLRAEPPRAGRTGAFGPVWLARSLRELLPDYSRASLCVAFSGGLDSTALLAAAAALRGRAGASLRALHVDHGLQGAAAQWVRHCRTVAASLQVPLTVRRVRVARTRGSSLEEQARNARRTAFALELQPGEVLLTAQHADDQLETVLLQLLRGAGLPGLAAMPDCARFAAGRLCRPLLGCTHAQLLAWARARQLEWVEDPTNQDERLDRNFLRSTVLPLVRQRWPAAAQSVTRSARHAADAQALLEVLATWDLRGAADGGDLDAAALRALAPQRRSNVLRHWIATHGHRVPDARRLAQISGALLAAREDANPQVSWESATPGTRILVTRESGRLQIRAVAPVEGVVRTAWRPRDARRLQLPAGAGVLELRDDAHGPIDLGLLPATLQVATRMGGEHLHTTAGAPRSLKKLLQGAAIPPAERARLPLLFDGARLLAAADLWIDGSIAASPTAAHRARLHWLRPGTARRRITRAN